ncbi:hypothetical protein [Aquimarina algicola]|nr:hypothetical protein [Aquimarina algicola]
MSTETLLKPEEVALEYQNFMQDVQKKVTINIALKDLEDLKAANYKLCFAKKVADKAYTVVWQSYDNYLFNNKFSWVPVYELFGSNIFESDIRVEVSTNVQQIQLGETSTLNSAGILEDPITAGPKTLFTLNNDYGSIHPGVNQLSTGINGETISTPIYVAEDAVVSGKTELKPVEKILVWFEQNIETSTMFSTSRSREVEIDLTNTNEASYIYENQEWKKQ